ncbi:hypothetical protein M408DRAFT_332956 [Serendipita vermifera MAFF 305830]|uniref:Major facilitator superfamily (MFS) profile domain-containing protein n=1 Tax=Serendipita vermifera MAFF 305830 TaxID=933852 RepID=A0A0C3ACK7_SERVB|nr:hypothetical protein M408DRAFT_332956 [Serendipita vermifera MAFF 305830]
MAVSGTPVIEMLEKTPNVLPETEAGAITLPYDEKDGARMATSKVEPVAAPDEGFGHPNEQGDNTTSNLSKVSKLRKIFLLLMFTCASFLDSFGNSALFPAVPVIAEELSFDPSETVWIISAYVIMFAAFLLMSGRISDLYTPKPAFIIGTLILGITNLAGGFMRQKIALLVLRALGGIGAALTIPSALSLIIKLFPDPLHQARAIALFNGAGAIGNIFGLLIGAILVQYAGWSWIFWFVAIVGVGISAFCFFLIPSTWQDKKAGVKFDVPGVGSLTVAVTLFIFAVISGSTKGWGTAYVLTPFLISITLFILFLVWEAHAPPEDAALPPRLWRLRNFGVLIGVAFLPHVWWATSFINLTSWWEYVYGWTAINTPIHFLPIGLGGFLVSQFTGYLPTYFAHKHTIISGLVLGIIATILLHFGDSPDTYWPFVFPAFLLGTAGMIPTLPSPSIVTHHHPLQVPSALSSIMLSISGVRLDWLPCRASPLPSTGRHHR